MSNGFAEKIDTKSEVIPDSKEKEKKKKKGFVGLLDEDNVEIKKLEAEDVEDVLKLMEKCSFDVTEKEVASVIKHGMSFGCYVNRMLIGIGLGWPTAYDPESRAITAKDYNAVYLEEPAVLLMYEGRGIRRILLKEREKDALARKFSYAIAYLSEELPQGSVVEYIKESGNQLEKLYLSENYEFFRTDRGILTVKRLPK